MRLKSSRFLVILAVLLLATLLEASQKYSFRFAYGVESDSDLGQIISLQKPTEHSYSFDVFSLDAGYLLAPSLFKLPLDIYIKGGTALFRSENLTQYPELTGIPDVNSKDIYEFTLYIKLYYNIDFADNRVRFGFGEGGSYATDYLAPEVIEQYTKHPENPKYSKYLNYLDISLDIDIGKLFGIDALQNTYLGYTLKHRSGIFGLINGVSGGSNYNTISIEKNF